MCTSSDNTPQRPLTATEQSIHDFFTEFALPDIAKAEEPFVERFAQVEARMRLATSGKDAWHLYVSLDQLVAFEKAAVADAAFRAGVRLGMALEKEMGSC